MNFIDFRMMTDLEHEYDEYVDECKAQGIEPKDLKTWWDELE